LPVLGASCQFSEAVINYQFSVRIALEGQRDGAFWFAAKSNKHHLRSASGAGKMLTPFD
jgi:hypothetical protein